MQQPFDVTAKALFEAALEGLCEVRVQAPVTPDTMYSDAVIEPIASEERLATRGLLGRLASRPCVFEPFVETVSRESVDRCLAKVLLLGARDHVQRRLWVISPGLPRQAIERWALRADRAFGAGVYTGVTEALPGIVVVRELPRARHTLLLRLMASGAVLREAVADAKALARDAWERPIVERVLLQMRHDLDRMMREQSSPSEELRMRWAELAAAVDKELAELRATAIDQGLAEGKAQGMAQGMAQGEALGVLAGERAALRAVLAARGLRSTATIEAAIDRCTDAELLRAWVTRAATATEIDAVFSDE